MPAPTYLVLLHHPITNRHGEVVTTSVTNMDIHDISRSARTYGIHKYFIVTPIEEQHHIVGRILDHWQSEKSKRAHPDRVEALSIVELKKEFSEVMEAIKSETGETAEVILPDARPLPEAVSYEELSAELKSPSRTRPVVLVLGTGWGIAESFYPVVDRNLAPIYGPKGREGYNHLSVRAAAATIMDRLFGQ